MRFSDIDFKFTSETCFEIRANFLALRYSRHFFSNRKFTSISQQVQK